MAVAPRQRGVELGSSGPHLFLSHSSKDDQIVSRIAKNLNTCGVDVWLDAWELRVGDDLHQRIADAIAKSKFVAVVVGGHFDGSKWTKGEVSQALSREKAEDRILVLPLLIEDVPPPPVLGSKKFLDFREDHYFESLVRLAGLVHDLDTEALETALAEVQPRDVRGCVEVLRMVDVQPYCVVDTKTLMAIKSAGGSMSGNIVRFDPRAIMANPNISPSLQRLMERLIDEWGL
jgi:hypothetical protein